MAIDRHKVFISFHSDDMRYKDYLINVNEYNFETHKIQSIFDDYSVGEGDIDDTNMTDEQVRITIRDKFIKGASVLILLCGEHTKERKFVDWELHSAMFDTENNPKMGIIVINLPFVSMFQACRIGEESEKNIVANPSANWTSFKNRTELEQNYPYMPSRIIDNFESLINNDDIIPITVVDWDKIANNSDSLKRLIDNAYCRSRNDNKHYNHSAPLMKRNRRHLFY